MIRTYAIVLLLTAALGVGCGGSASVSLSSRVGAKRLGSSGGALQQALQLPNGITITRLRMVIRELELEQPESSGASEDNDGEDLEKGPYLIDLSAAQLEGGAVKQLSAEIPAGTYKEIEFRIQKLMGKERDDARFKEMVDADASIIVTGTVDGAAFEFVTSVDEKQEFEGNIVVGEKNDNVTLNIDPTGWFTGTAGRLDPRDNGNRSKIEANIKNSLELFEDDDSDGSHDD